MQLCERCTQYETCQLDKRRLKKTFDACLTPPFKLIKGMPQRQYEAIKKQMLRLQDKAADAARPTQTKVVIENDIPTAVTTEDFWPAEGLPPDLFVHFANCDFADGNEREEFIKNSGDADQLIFCGAWRPDHNNHKTLLAIQEELDLVMDPVARSGTQGLCVNTPIHPPKLDPLRVLNKWLSRLDFQVKPYPVFDSPEEREKFEQPYRVSKGHVERDDQGDVERDDQGKIIAVHSILSQVEEDRLVQKGVEIVELHGWHSLAWRIGRNLLDAELHQLVPHMVVRPPDRFPDSNRYALLFHQFTRSMLARQELKRCPNPKCNWYFFPQDRENAGPTCGKNACYVWWTRQKKKVV